MPLPNGSADKIGNSYVAKWLIKQMIKLLKDRLSCLYLEPLG